MLTIFKLQLRFVEDMDLAGAYIWTLDFDDFTSHCEDRYPLLREMNTVLRPNTLLPTPTTTAASEQEKLTFHTTTVQPTFVTPTTPVSQTNIPTTQKQSVDITSSTSITTTRVRQSTHDSTFVASTTLTKKIATATEQLPTPEVTTAGSAQTADIPLATTSARFTRLTGHPSSLTSTITNRLGTTLQTEIPKSKRCAEQVFSCPGDGSFRNPDHCGQFYMCVHFGTRDETIYLLECPVRDTLVFDEKSHSCIYFYELENYAELCTCQIPDPITL